MKLSVMSLLISVLVLSAATVATAHEEYAPGAFIRLGAGYLVPTQDFSNDYSGDMSGTVCLGMFVTPSVRAEGKLLYTLTMDPDPDGSAPGDLIVLSGEVALGYEISPSSDATPYIEVLGGYYTFGVENSADDTNERYGAPGVGVGVGMVTYPEFFSGSLDFGVRYRYIFSNEDDAADVAFVQEGFNNSFLTVCVAIGFHF